jgi:hypothetical protein
MMNLQQRLHEMTWDFRQDTASVFPIPNRADSLRFALCEAAEALDAWLRRNGDYKRNRQKEHDIAGELAQCVMMLMTAYGDREYKPGEFYKAIPSLDDIVYWVAKANLTGNDGTIRFAVWMICRYSPTIGDDLAQVLDGLRAKHGEKVTA